MPILSTSTLIRARARLTRSQFWRSKIRSTASVTRRYSPSSAADELVQGRRDPRHDRGAAADDDREALDAVPDPREEADVVDADDRAVGVGGRERGLDLARHQLRRRVADEVADVGDRVLGRVEGLVGGDAGPGVAGDVADRVAAALAAGEAGVGDLADQSRGVGQRHVVHLDVLARRDVALVERHVLLDDAGEGIHLLGGDAAERQLDADHLHVGLALAVDALLEAEADELVLGGLRRPGTCRTRRRSRRTRRRGSGSRARGRSRRPRGSRAIRPGPCPSGPCLGPGRGLLRSPSASRPWACTLGCVLGAEVGSMIPFLPSKRGERSAVLRWLTSLLKVANPDWESGI